MRGIKILSYVVIQCTWGVIQTLIGFLLFMAFIKCKHEFYHGSVKTLVNRNYNVSLGLFIFVTAHCDPKVSESITIHEYGHTIQSLILGPLYLLVVGIASVVWCNMPYFKNMRTAKGVPYSYLWVEGWADRLGRRFVGDVGEDD